MKIASKLNTKDSYTVVDRVAIVVANDIVVDGATPATVNNDHVIQTQNRLITKCENTELYAMKDDNTTIIPTAIESVQCATSTHNDNHCTADDDVETLSRNTITYLMPSDDFNDNFVVVVDGSNSSSSSSNAKLCGACARPQRTNSFLCCRLHQSNSSIHCRHQQNRKANSKANRNNNNNSNEEGNEEGNNSTTTTDGCINQDIGINETTKQIPDSEPLSSKWDAIGIEQCNIDDITRQHQLKQVAAVDTRAAGITTPTLLSSFIYQQKENCKINCENEESKFNEHGVQVVPSTPAGVNDYCRASSAGIKFNYKQSSKCANVENCWKIFDSSSSSSTSGSADEKIVQLTCNVEHQRCADGEFCNKIGCRQCLNENAFHLPNLVAKSNIVRGSPPPLSLVAPLSGVKIRVPKSNENFPFAPNRQCDDNYSSGAVKIDVIANNVAEYVAGPISPNSDNFEASNRLRRLENRFKDLSCTKKLLRVCDRASGTVSLHGSSISLCSLISDKENYDGTAVTSLSVRPASAIDPPPSSLSSILPQTPLHSSSSPPTINTNRQRRRRLCKSPTVIVGPSSFQHSQRLQCAATNNCDNEQYRSFGLSEVETRRETDALLTSTIRPDTSCTPESLSTDSEEIRNIFPDDERPPTPRQQLNVSGKFQTNCEFDAQNLPNFCSQLNRVFECYDELEFDYFDSDIYDNDDGDDDGNTSCDCSIDAIPVYRPCIVMRETAAGPLRGLLKKPNRPASSRKNRVVFDEKRNEFFDADYIILIREDCPYDEEDEEPCTCGEHELVRLCCDEGCQCTAYSEETRTPQVSN